MQLFDIHFYMLCICLQLFDKVRQAHPDFHSKLVPIESDLTEPDLALSEDDIRTLQEETELVFHVAATVRFDEKLS